MQQAPHETVWTLATAVIASRTLQIIAELGVADLVGETSVTVKELASGCDADPEALERALLLLAAHGIFERTADGFAHTEASRLLSSDHPMSMRSFPRMMGMPAFTASFDQLEHSIRTASPSFELVDPEGLFAYLQRHPDEARIFDQSMTSKAAADIAAVLAAYDFTRFSTVADIGGGRGHLLRAVLHQAPAASGILFDLPAVIDSLDISNDRVTLVAGDFFTDSLPSTEAYILMEVIHDWDDAQATAILTAVGRAAPPGATVLIIETAAEDQLDPRVQTLDMIMLTITGGRERTSPQLRQLLDSAGLGAGEVFDTPGTMRIVEAVAR